MSEKILIVDDDIDSLKLIGLMLKRSGYEVVAASTGNQAITKANSELPDLIILDVMMPDMNGYEVCKRLRTNPDTQQIPIIMFTAKTLIDDKVAGFEAGADDYLTKPTHPAELASRVRVILDRSNTKQNKTESKGISIGVLGTKGGIGTSTIALNVAAAFHQIDSNTNPILVDFRLGNGGLGLLMGINKSTGMATMVSKSPAEIADTVEQELITHSSGLRALLSSTRPQEALTTISPDTAVNVIHSLQNIGNPTVFDLGNGYSQLIHKIQVEMDALLVLVEPTSINLPMARELLQELGKTKKDRIHIVIVNRNKLDSQPEWHEIEQILNHEISAIISPAPELVYQSMTSGIPLVVQQPNSIVASQINKLVDDLKNYLDL